MNIEYYVKLMPGFTHEDLENGEGCLEITRTEDYGIESVYNSKTFIEGEFLTKDDAKDLLNDLDPDTEFPY